MTCDPGVPAVAEARRFQHSRLVDVICEAFASVRLNKVIAGNSATRSSAADAFAAPADGSRMFLALNGSTSGGVPPRGR